MLVDLLCVIIATVAVQSHNMYFQVMVTLAHKQLCHVRRNLWLVHVNQNLRNTDLLELAAQQGVSLALIAADAVAALFAGAWLLSASGRLA